MGAEQSRKSGTREPQTRYEYTQRDLNNLNASTRNRLYPDLETAQEPFNNTNLSSAGVQQTRSHISVSNASGGYLYVNSSTASSTTLNSRTVPSTPNSNVEPLRPTAPPPPSRTGNHFYLDGQSCGYIGPLSELRPTAPMRSPPPRFGNNAAAQSSHVVQTTPTKPPLSSTPPTKPPPSSTPPVLSENNKPAKSRSRSASRHRNRNNKNNGVQCSTCNGDFGVDIFQCNSGHSFCLECRDGGAYCGLCHEPITDRRNFSLQDWVAETRTACPYAAEGCSLHFKLGTIGMHAKECPFQVIQCPMAEISGQCSWRGKISQIVSHFDDMHPEQRQADVNQELVLPHICYNTHYVHLVAIGSFHFLVHIQVADSNIYMAVQMLSTQHSAAKWYYEFHVYNKREPRRKFQYNDVCKSITADYSVDRSKCAVLALPYAMTFVNEGSVTYKFFIKKDFKPNKDYQPKNDFQPKKYFQPRNEFVNNRRGRGGRYQNYVNRNENNK